MDAETVSLYAFAITTGVGAAISGIVAAWQSLQAKRSAQTAATSADTAALMSAPTSNGFAASVLGSLAEIKATQTQHGLGLRRVEDRLDTHLQRGHHVVADR